MSDAWRPGQRAIIDRYTIVTIDRVTQSGRAVAGDRTFERDGRERGGGRVRISRLELLTPEIEAEIALIERGNKASHHARVQIEAADRWLRTNFSSWGRSVPEAADVDKAERLVAAIRQVMEDKP